MKRLVIAVAIIAMLGIISPSLPTTAQPAQVPHENPTTVTGSLDKVTLLLSYSQIINLATSRQYQDAQDILNELRRADFPDELRDIIDLYHNLCQQLFTNLDNLDSLLDEASALLAHQQIHEVKQRLDDAEVDIQDIGLLLEDIEVANDTLNSELGVFASPAASQIRQAHTRLEESLERLIQLLDRLNTLQHSLIERYVQMTELIPTELSLSITPLSAFVGDTVTASGKLSSDGRPLAGRTITLGNKPITTANDGSYTANITIPYKYVATIMEVIAVYEPSGDDIGVYLASQSPPVTISTRFYQTLLEVSEPGTMHPGLPGTISGRVGSIDGETDRAVRVLLDDTPMAEATVAGQFSLEVTPPEEASTGKHNLTVSVTPQGRYSGAAETRTVNISKLPIYVDTKMPSLALLLKTIQISGRVYHEFGPVPNARLSLSFRDSSGTARTSPDGSFTTSLEAPLDLFLAGPQGLTMTIAPAEPWLNSLTVKRQLFTINPLSTGLILAILIFLGTLAYRERQTRASEEKGMPQVEVTELPAITPTPESRPRLTGIKGRILSAYRGGLEAVEKVTGVGMAPNITLREFLKMATLLAPTATGQFAELTTIAEVTLYSDYNPREDNAARAEQLADIIKEELRRGTS